MDQTPPDTIDLRDYLSVVVRQWRLIAGATLVVTLTAVALSLIQTPQYASTVEMAIEPVRSGSEAALEDLLLRDEIVETERRIITSRMVTDRVIDELSLDLESTELLESVEVRTIANTRVVTVTVTDPSPQWAADVANAFATSYLEYRRDRALDEVTAARTNLDDRARELREQIDALDLELQRSGGVTGGIDQDVAGLQSQRDTLAQQLTQIQIQLATLDPGTDAVRGGGEILVPAEPSGSPVSPRPLRTGVLALVLGLMLGVGLAFLRDHFDDVVRSEDDVVRAAHGAPIIARITAWGDTTADSRLITVVDPFAGASEEFAAMAANVRFTLLGRAGAPMPEDDTPTGRSVTITSSAAGEGKTTVAGNLAVAAAASGRRVVLVGADLRKPTMAARFGLSRGLGLTDLLLDSAALEGSAAVTNRLLDVGVSRLRVLPAGSVPPNPTELLASPQMAWLHRTLTELADLVIYDTPPLLPVADTLEIAQHTDLTFIVSRAGHGHRRELTQAIERLERVGTAVGGVVVNGLETARGRYGYAYGYGYRPESAEYRPEPPAVHSQAFKKDARAGGPRPADAQAQQPRPPAPAEQAPPAEPAPPTEQRPSTVTVPTSDDPAARPSPADDDYLFRDA